MIDLNALQQASVRYVRSAIDRVLSNGDMFFTKTEAGGASHVGTSDIDNTELAYAFFREFDIHLVIEEDLPPYEDWEKGKPVFFIDPVDGSSEVGCGGTQFASAVSLYGENGTPIFSVAGSPGLRPIYRQRDNTFSGFSSCIGSILYGGPSGVHLEPLWPTAAQGPLILPHVSQRTPDSSPYTSLALDPNWASICGLRKSHKLTKSNISRMPYSNIYSQMQVILGQADAATLGPTTRPPSEDRTGAGISGPKAWDLIMPLAHGVGLDYYIESMEKIDRLNDYIILDSYVLSTRLYLMYPDYKEYFLDEYKKLLDIN